MKLVWFRPYYQVCCMRSLVLVRLGQVSNSLTISFATYLGHERETILAEPNQNKNLLDVLQFLLRFI